MAVLLRLQRLVGNHGVASLLQRNVAGSASLGMRLPPVLDPAAVAAEATSDYGAACQQVVAWLERGRSGNGGPTLGLVSVAELVNAAGKLEFRQKSGAAAIIASRVKPSELEYLLRNWARTHGVALRENRDPSDVGGTASQVSAILENLRDLTTIKLGGDKANLTLELTGKAMGQVEADDLTLGAEASPGGASLSVTDAKKSGAALKVGPEGVGGSLQYPGGKLGMEFSTKGFKVELSAGDLKLSGKVQPKGSDVEWSAEVSLGTIGKIVSGAEIAKLAHATSDALTKAATGLRDGLNPETITPHVEPIKAAVSEIAEAAKQIAETKPGARIGVEAKGSGEAGLSVSVTLTIVF